MISITCSPYQKDKDGIYCADFIFQIEFNQEVTIHR